MQKNEIYVPLITPFNADGSVAYDKIGNAVEFVLKDGADGIYATGSSGECFILSAEERKKCLSAIIEAAGSAPVIAHVGNIGTEVTLDLLKHAERAGASYAASVPPFYFGFTFAEVKRYFSDLADSTALPFMIYNLTGIARAFSAEELLELLDHKNIYAIKYTDKNYYVLERLKNSTDKLIYSGADECFLPALTAGAHGAIGTTFNFMVDKYITIKKLFNEGKIKEAMAVQTSANNVTKLLVDGNGYAVTKYIMQLKGLDIEPNVRKPFLPLTLERKKIIEKIVEENL